MKSLKKAALVSAIAAVSSGAQAELQALDDSTMGELTGQAGITIDVETKWEIGEFVYKDAGHLVIEGIRMGGNSIGDGTGTRGSFLDNHRLTIDIAGSGAPDPSTGNPDNVLAYGHSELRTFAQIYVDNGQAGTFADVASGVDSTRQDEVTGANLLVDAARSYDDGDLVIHFDHTDPWDEAGGFAAYTAAGRFATDGWTTAEDISHHAVDFRMEIDSIGLASSDYLIGAQAGESDDPNKIDGGAATTTTLISDLSIQGYLGPADLLIENDGDGVDGTGQALLLGATEAGNADSKIIWGSFVYVTDMDITIDIAGVTLEDIKIHNNRGDLSSLDGTSSFGFAHSIREIYRVENDVLDLTLLATGLPFTDGLALNTQFKGDIDIGAIKFGDDDRSIGEIYLTDVISTTNWTISAH